MHFIFINFTVILQIQKQKVWNIYFYNILQKHSTVMKYYSRYIVLVVMTTIISWLLNPETIRSKVMFMFMSMSMGVRTCLLYTSGRICMWGINWHTVYCWNCKDWCYSGAQSIKRKGVIFEDDRRLCGLQNQLNKNYEGYSEINFRLAGKEVLLWWYWTKRIDWHCNTRIIL